MFSWPIAMVTCMWGVLNLSRVSYEKLWCIIKRQGWENYIVFELNQPLAQGLLSYSYDLQERLETLEGQAQGSLGTWVNLGHRSETALSTIPTLTNLCVKHLHFSQSDLCLILGIHYMLGSYQQSRRWPRCVFASGTSVLFSWRQLGFRSQITRIRILVQWRWKLSLSPILFSWSRGARRCVIKEGKVQGSRELQVWVGGTLFKVTADEVVAKEWEVTITYLRCWAAPPALGWSRGSLCLSLGLWGCMQVQWPLFSLRSSWRGHRTNLKRGTAGLQGERALERYRVAAGVKFLLQLWTDFPMSGSIWEKTKTQVLVLLSFAAFV